MLSTCKRKLPRENKRRPYHSHLVWGIVFALVVTYGLGIGHHVHVPQIQALATDHMHAVEVHVGAATELVDSVLNDHADATWFTLDLNGQSITKKTPSADFALILLGALLLLYTLRATNARRIPLSLVVCPKHKSVYSVFPPSRAPPR